MAKPPYFRVFLSQNNENYLFCRLFQQKSDNSLILQIVPRKGGTGGTAGKILIEKNPFDIYYDAISKPTDFEHTSIHSTGQSHTKLKDGTYQIHNDKSSNSIPLDNLSTVKHISTIVCREMDENDLVERTRATDIPLIREASQQITIIDMLAVPKGINLNFTGEWEMSNDHPVRLTVGLHKLAFNGFDLILFTRHSDEFEHAPPKSIQLPDLNNHIPTVIKVDNEKITVKVSSLTFDKVLSTEQPNDGFTTITATPKWL